MKVLKYLSFCLSILSAFNTVDAQIALDYCQTKARENFPAVKRFGLIEAAKQYDLDNAGKARLPQISLSGQMTYQSAVTQIPVSVPGITIPQLDKDQYKIAIDASLLIWDGGNIKAGSKVVEAGYEVETASNEANVYALKDQINRLYFGILSIDEQMKQSDVLKDNLESNKRFIASAVKNGVAMQSDSDLISVEILQIDQARIELEYGRKAYVNMLSAMTGEKLPDNVALEIPEEIVPSKNLKRPETEIFKKQRDFYNAKDDAVTAKNMPVIGVFVQGGYGKPGLNMLNNGFAPFAIGGLRFTWNFGSLYTTKNERGLIKIGLKNADAAEEIFEYDNNLQLIRLQNETEKIGKTMERDDEIIRLRTAIRESSESKYKNGVYTVTDLVKDINAESKAKLDKALHRILYLMSLYDQKFIAGN